MMDYINIESNYETPKGWTILDKSCTKALVLKHMDLDIHFSQFHRNELIQTIYNLCIVLNLEYIIKKDLIGMLSCL